MKGPRYGHRRGAANLAAIVSFAAIVMGCSNNSGDPGLPLPPAVPPGANLVQEELSLGASDAGHRLFALTCVDNILTVATTTNIVYAELPCDRSLPTDVVARFAGKPTEIRVEAGPPGKLFLISGEGGSVEFTVGRVWIVGL